ICLSSSHVAYSSIRMEPVYMVIGQSAAVAAAMAIDNNVAVQDISYADLAAKLEGLNQIIKTQ
ncbi:MAG: FAD-dependent oxidoreductase, partial [Pedobacter sp.]